MVQVKNCTLARVSLDICTISVRRQSFQYMIYSKYQQVKTKCANSVNCKVYNLTKVASKSKKHWQIIEKKHLHVQ